MWGMGILAILLAMISLGLSWLVLPFMANQHLREHLRKGGFTLDEASVPAQVPFKINRDPVAQKYNSMPIAWGIFGLLVFAWLSQYFDKPDVLKPEVKAQAGSTETVSVQKNTGKSIFQNVVDLAVYETLFDGMSYTDVTRVIGSAGEEMSRSELGNIDTVMYSWKNRDGSNMNAMFQNDRLIQKAQFGLR